MTDPGQHIEIACHMRARARPESVNTLVARLRDLANTGSVAKATFRPWPRTVELDTAANDCYLDIYRQFEQWAASHDAEIHPPFSVRRVDSSITGVTHHELVTPVLCLALSTSEELVGVFPHTAAGDTYTAQDVIDTLEAGDELATLSPAIRTPLADEHTEDSPPMDDRLSVPDPS